MTFKVSRFSLFSVKTPEDGVHCYGMFIEGARWCEKQKSLVEQQPKIIINKFPLIHFMVIFKDFCLNVLILIFLNFHSQNCNLNSVKIHGINVHCIRQVKEKESYRQPDIQQILSSQLCLTRPSQMLNIGSNEASL